jgi:hypothetical protein
MMAAMPAPDRSAEFGCRQCYRDEDARAVWGRHRLRAERRLVDDVHFIVQILRCAECGQRFASIFTEFVDWSGGDDAQYRDVVPLDEGEAERLAAQGEDVDLAWLGGLGADRRSLRSDWPTGARERRIRWTTGPIHIVPGH